MCTIQNEELGGEKQAAPNSKAYRLSLHRSHSPINQITKLIFRRLYHPVIQSMKLAQGIAKRQFLKNPWGLIAM